MFWFFSSNSKPSKKFKNEKNVEQLKHVKFSRFISLRFSDNIPMISDRFARESKMREMK